jgi:hypothetical protein
MNLKHDKQSSLKKANRAEKTGRKVTDLSLH